jgi:uncharacterized paraquat-inducible protein A
LTLLPERAKFNAAREEESCLAYLNCPTCRLTVYSPVPSVTAEECPRCRAKLGKVSRLFRSALPPRLLDIERRARKSAGESR